MLAMHTKSMTNAIEASMGERITILTAHSRAFASSVGLALFLCPALQGQDFSAGLTDKIFHGSGSIDLMKDLDSGQITQYFDANNNLKLGVDLNEDASGNESRDSVGVAIKSIELAIQTSAGSYTFTDFYTSTSAMILEAGAAEAAQFQTLIGTLGSSQITGSGDIDIRHLDDIIEMRNVEFEGEVTSAFLSVNFLDTADTGVEGNETFFDWSNGFEDFAILSASDASALSAAELGQAAASETVAFSASPATPPAAPAPPIIFVAALGAFALIDAKRKRRQ